MYVQLQSSDIKNNLLHEISKYFTFNEYTYVTARLIKMINFITKCD